MLSEALNGALDEIMRMIDACRHECVKLDVSCEQYGVSQCMFFLQHLSSLHVCACHDNVVRYDSTQT